jgi:hypothetical protein
MTGPGAFDDDAWYNCIGCGELMGFVGWCDCCVKELAEEDINDRLAKVTSIQGKNWRVLI